VTTPIALHTLLDRSARDQPRNVAIEEPTAHGPDHQITYAALAELSDRVRDRLHELGVRASDRVGIYLRKSIDAVALIFGILKTGACYVPVDPTAPVARNAYILNDCSVRVVILERRFEGQLRAEFQELGPLPQLLVLEGAGGGEPLSTALDREDNCNLAPATATVVPGPDDLAYILYTSGSTGRPKGVMLSHTNAVSFIDWCSEVFTPTDADRFSSHAPFHFDLSILDLYVSIKHGAALVLIGEEVGKDPHRLAPLIADRHLTVWYSAPSILSLLAQYGALQTRGLSALRLVLFAGEVFPVKHLRALQALLPRLRYFNLYGPTETNVCTFYEIPGSIPEERTEPFPIGRACSHLRTRVVDSELRPVAAGQEGELCVSGAGVMRGYWNLPEPSARAFLVDSDGAHWYRTGDIVAEKPDGAYVFLGRRDRMVKRRGYRVELGEIEAGLYRHPAVREAGVIALADQESGVRIKAFLACYEDRRPSLIEMKRFCADHLPAYMIPDLFSFRPALPKTSTDKIDYQRLKEME
jgi:amino acid adenylation domain-containing protein